MGLLSRTASRLRSLLGRRAPEPPAPQAEAAPPAPAPAPQEPEADVLFVNGTNFPTLHRYRVENQREQLELRGLTTDEVHYVSARAHHVDHARAVLIYRCPYEPFIEELVDHAHEQGKPVFFDVDDLVCDTAYTDQLPFVQGLPHDERLVFDDGVLRTGRTLSLCDGVVVTTERLASELGRVSPRVLVNRNVASQELVRISEAALSARTEHDGVVLGYFSGSKTHDADLMVALPALVDVLDARPETRLMLLGEVELPEQLLRFGDRIVRSPLVDWTELPALIASADINLAPLERTIFNEAKSENKWTEAALVGVPTAASDFGAFAHVIDSGRTGFLCSDTDSWRDTLLALVDSRELREDVGERARLWCLAHATTATTGALLAQLLAPATPTAEGLSPSDPQLRGAYVDALLATRGLERPQLSYLANPWEGVGLERRLDDAQEALTCGRRIALFVYERSCGDDATFRYFGYNTSQRLSASKRWFGTWLFVDELEDEQVQVLVARAAGIVLVRCRVRPELVALAELAGKAGVPVAYCLDDNALGAKTAPRIIRDMASDQASEFERNFWCGVTERFRLASELASCFFAPLANYAELLAHETGKPAFVVHSSLNDEQVAVARSIVARDAAERADGRFLVGYFSGTYSHRADFALARDGLVQLLENHPDACLLLGGRIELDDGLVRLLEAGRVMVVPPVDYVTLQYLQAACDVVVAPLVVDDFTNCKSALKVFEAGIVGTPACASASFAYAESIVDGETGFICQGDGDWPATLEHLYQAMATDPEAWSRAARSQAEDRYYGAAVMAELEEACENLAAQPAPGDVSAIAALLAEKDVEDWDNPFTTNPLFAL